MVGKELKGILANNYYEVKDLINRLLDFIWNDCWITWMDHIQK